MCNYCKGGRGGYRYLAVIGEFVIIVANSWYGFNLTNLSSLYNALASETLAVQYVYCNVMCVAV